MPPNLLSTELKPLPEDVQTVGNHIYGKMTSLELNYQQYFGSILKSFLINNYLYAPSWFWLDTSSKITWICPPYYASNKLKSSLEVLHSVTNLSHPKFFQQIQGFRRCKITWRKWNFVQNNLDFRTISCLKWSQTYGILWYSMVKWSHNWCNVHLMSNFVFSSTFRSRSFDEFISTFKLVRNSFSEFVRHFVIWWSYPQVLLANFG